MLKLTNSFYRYLAFTCEKVNKAHVRRFSHLNCKRKACGTECVGIKLSTQCRASLQLRQHSHGKKRLKIKIPPLNAHECKRHTPMSDPPQPSIHHASHGGQFDVSSESNDYWWRQASGEASSDESNGASHTLLPQTFRIWESLGCSQDPKQGPSLQFKVLSYNLLAQYLLECHPYLYTNCSPNDLKWETRAERLYDEITSLSPDIICLQEVQSSHLDTFFSRFEQIGYTKIFKKKTGHRGDGCAIYYKTTMFYLKDYITVEFNQPDLPLLNRDNIGILVKLAPYELPTLALVVATTHLLYNPKRTDVRLAQMQVFLAEIDRFAYYDNGQESGHHPIILTGDFNSTPDSAVIKLLERGQVSASQYRDHSDWRRIGVTDNSQHLSVFLNRQQGRTTGFAALKIYNSELSPAAPNSHFQSAALLDQFSPMFNGSHISHSLELNSVYNSSCGVTTFQDYWVTVDYMYFSSHSSLRLMERYLLPSETECEAQVVRLPNNVYGSDHLALAAIFELKPDLPTL